MKDDTRKRLAALIAEELSEKIKAKESLKHKLEAFTDLPVDKVADAILKQFEYLLSSDLRDLIIHLIMQDVNAGKAAAAPEPEVEKVASAQTLEPVPGMTEEEKATEIAAPVNEEIEATTVSEGTSESVMEYFGQHEPFQVDEIDFQIEPEDWFYIYGFSYAPASDGKGIPSKKLQIKGIDDANEIFLLDYGDVRLYLSKLIAGDYTFSKSGKPIVSSQQAHEFQYDHERIINILRGQEIIVALPFWSVVQGREHIIKLVEDNYVELLRSLIDVHDAVDWDVEVFAYDEHIARHPSVVSSVKERDPRRELRQQPGKKVDIKLWEKVVFKEKSLAQEIHSDLLLHATKGKIDHIITLDSAFLNDWKTILSARYTVGKEKRKTFCAALAETQEKLREYELMLRMSSPTVRFTIPLS